MPPRNPNSEEVFDFVVNKGNGIKGLVDAGIETVPDLYILPVEDRLEASEVVSVDSIPVIDASNLDDPKVTDSICEAASKWGFFQIINHGVPLQVLNNVREAAHKFHGLPYQEKNKYWVGNSPTHTVTLTTSFAPQAETALEWKDYLAFRFVPGDQESFALWPPVCREEVVEYMKRAEPVIWKLLKVLLKGINVKEIDKAREYTFLDTPVVYCNYYPRCPNPDLTAGVLPHSDIATLTLLLQDDSGGLYVRATDDHSWIHVPPIHGALVINIGDCLQIMSNDRYKSVEHRVVANASNNRVSVPIFANPGFNAAIGPLPEVLQTGEKPLYKQVIFSDYLKHHCSKKHEGKKTMDFARI
ncbi:Oxoglutarate/iron-dependent dioxygenase [Corchorus olitorius]|uniref:Oxoglutarate/iron-dependent dioxygenase n=1 Tax=Corchorus olitorius TaxID=93759 RepID=A0A1R3GVA5_9ROSI|nr:Oxoglutarate/iron-dependent dioxygenase [Corchorus olitorius]